MDAGADDTTQRARTDKLQGVLFDSLNEIKDNQSLYDYDSKPPPKHKFTEKREKAFLEMLAKTGNIALASRHSGIQRTYIYKRMKKKSFAALVDAAMEEAGARLEAECRRRGMEGTLRGVYQTGKLVGVERVFSDTCLVLLLKAHFPEKYRERQDVTSGGKQLESPKIIIVPPEPEQQLGDGHIVADAASRDAT